MKSKHARIQTKPFALGFVLGLLALWVAAAATSAQAAGADKAGDAASRYFTIRVVDEQTGRGVPLVELRTVNNVRYYTDSAGVVAFDEPGLMGQRVFFHVESHGYEFPADGFGFRGRRLEVTPGGQATLKIKRTNIAERLYRVTGAGIYRDSVFAGRPVPIDEPLLNAQVMGSDSVVSAVYRGRIYWFWGDTKRPSYPLGNFHVPGATSLLPADGGLDPETGVDLAYFVGEDGFAKPTAKMPGKGPTWLGGLVVLEDTSGRERLCATYVKVEAPLNIYERGLAVFNDEKNEFERLRQLDLDAPLYPGGHPLKHSDGGVEYVYFPSPYPFTRVPATFEAWQDPSRYETYTCVRAGTGEDAAELDRDGNGRLRYAWRRDAVPLTPEFQSRWIEEGRINAEEGLFQLRNADTGKPVRMHSGSVNWNAFRKRWILIGVESLGTSALGEVWYSEAPAPEGPWLYARKIVTHEKYSFYNPKQHAFLDKEGGRVVFFEGTYTNTFSGNPDQTPRYDYNQVMYKLDLADPRLKLPDDDAR